MYSGSDVLKCHSDHCFCSENKSFVTVPAENMEFEEFILGCERFFNGFHANGANPDDHSTLYEQAISWAMDQIAELQSVIEEELGRSRYPFLVSEENKMGLFKRVVRQHCE